MLRAILLQTALLNVLYNRNNISYEDGYQIINSVTNFNNLVTAGTSGVWLVLTTFTMSASKTLPAGVKLEFRDTQINLGGFDLTGTDTKIDANLNQIFVGQPIGTWDVDNVYPEWFGTTGDGLVDDLVEIQYAEDFSTLTTTKRSLIFTKSYAVSNNINKASNVDWCGGGEIVKKDAGTITGASKALVLCDTISNFTISNLSFKNVLRGYELSSGMTSAVTKGDRNTIIDVYVCSDFSIKDNLLENFAQGIQLRGCDNFSVKGNNIYANTGKTAEEIIAPCRRARGSHRGSDPSSGTGR